MTTHMVPPVMLPLPVQQAAAAQGLGTFMKAYKTTVVRTIIGSFVFQVANQQIYLFERGVVIDKRKQIQAFPWNQTAEVWQSITRNYRNGRYVGATHVYTLRRIDGYQLKLNNLTKDIADLGSTIAQNITRELVPRALHTIRAGQTLTFASFSLNQQGIGNGREFLPWSQVQGVEVQQGRVTVKKAGNIAGLLDEKGGEDAQFPRLYHGCRRDATPGKCW